ncbi:hypothetical protein VOLCADRAFT_103053 [Volvox carteri f. nagariensis]|uniref:glucose-6-phosphate dehydrogenase (NADP(+)) n=1 Tax=Volvox carteri f. nagariensis TaxID=3068 RepID=D8TJM1_VOLCA|nr:uncharacterized protein VOLCADRAFT_103053 [Volvox carteri f. nagariensis]EFJ52396.1 hypothetical protein VOLCADRAFT_103053 [Volvox carteri f. nagariensis]|eukprot:XP_002946469.1 hypothetical protein VOLCADRAFT_103053 [Volvox carteri f. nagariensis]
MSRLASKELEAIAKDAALSVSGDNGTAETLQKLVLERVCSSARDEWHADAVDDLGKQLRLSIVVFGASGDLAKKKTYPALYELFKKGFLPRRVQIVGYARSKMSSQELRERLRAHLERDCECVEQFLNCCSYMAGEYDTPEGYERLGSALQSWEQTMCLGVGAAATAAGVATASGGALGGGNGGGGGGGGGGPLLSGPRLGRLFYLALPPSVYPQVCEHIKTQCSTLYGRGGGGGSFGHTVGEGSGRGRLFPAAEGSFVRLVLEKPFGHDLQSSELLAQQIGSYWPEEQLYRIDHYLGKELVQNLLMLRFANPIFGAFFNRHYISNIQITFKEPFGTEGRGGYFDQYGIIRDVIQNHLIQVLALLTMEAPVSLHPDDIRDEKVKVLRCVAPVGPGDCVLGQYVADKVRIQLRTPPASIFGSLEHMRNELVIRFQQPGEAIYAKMVVKKPGLEMEYEMSELDLSYPERYKGIVIPDAYERLILDCIRGDQQHFVRRDELRAAWAIFTPLLHAVDAGAVAIHPYPYGSRGPAAVDPFITESGYWCMASCLFTGGVYMSFTVTVGKQLGTRHEFRPLMSRRRAVSAMILENPQLLFQRA